MNSIEQMRVDWNRRAREDANFYAGFGRQDQDEDDFRASAFETVALLKAELPRLPSNRRALEIGCGPGRLLLPVSEFFSEVHGVDISDEMIGLARQRLRLVTNAHLHVSSGSDLGEFADGYFDFVYSYIVFQHIPSREIVLSYLMESLRVLRKGGILCCQLRGTPPSRSESEKRAATWTGCYFTAADIAAFSRDRGFPLVALGGVNTQYMWATFRKRSVAIDREPRGAVLKAVTAAKSGEAHVPARGREAVVSLWIDRFPADGSLAEFQVAFGEYLQTACYLSPVGETGGCQINALLPAGIKPGKSTIRLAYAREPLPSAHDVDVTPAPPLTPRVTTVTDGINLRSAFRSETGGLKVRIEDVAIPSEISFDVCGRQVDDLEFECIDPIANAYEFSFNVRSSAAMGKSETLTIRLLDEIIERVTCEFSFSGDSTASGSKTGNDEITGRYRHRKDAP